METVEVITSVERRRHWSTQDKKALVAEAEQPGKSVSAVASKYGILTRESRYIKDPP